MASSITLRRATTSSLLSKLIRPATVSRSFNTNAQVANVGGGDDRSVDVERRSDRSVSQPRRRDTSPGFFADVFDPFLPPRSLSQVLNMMDQLVDPFLSRGGAVSPSRRGWDVKEDDNTLLLRIDMPGVSKENVKVSMQQNTLIIKGEGEKESEDDEESGGRRYSSRIDLPPHLYKLDEIKAEMKNGVLKIVVPKVREEERKDVHEVKVE